MILFTFGLCWKKSAGGGALPNKAAESKTRSSLSIIVCRFVFTSSSSSSGDSLATCEWQN